MISHAKNRAPRGVRTLALLTFTIAGAASLSGCFVPIVLGGAAGAAVVVTDRRSSGTQVDDENIEFKVGSQIRTNFDSDRVRVNASSYEGQVLIVGDAPSEDVKNQITRFVRGVPGVKTVVNQITVDPVMSFSGKSNDTWLTSKVRSALLNAHFVPSGSIAVTTDHSVVYLQGAVTDIEGQYASNAAAGVSGVAKVVKLFTRISREDAMRLSNSGSSNDNRSTPAPEQQPAPIESGTTPGTGGGVDGAGTVQAIPIK
jgi:osmotically-inducible protein OsmY